MVSTKELFDPEYRLWEDQNLWEIVSNIRRAANMYSRIVDIPSRELEELDHLSKEITENYTELVSFMKIIYDESEFRDEIKMATLAVINLIRCSFLIGRRVEPSEAACAYIEREQARRARNKYPNIEDEAKIEIMINMEICRLFSKWDGRMHMALAKLISKALARKKIIIGDRAISRRKFFGECLSKYRDGQRKFNY